jgi:cation:H+ antiporter
LAIGNVVGSCLLNLMLVLGGTALVTGSQGLNVSPDLIHDDLPVMLLTSLACLPIFWTRGRISRLEGGLLLSLYVLYIVDNVLPRTNLSSWSDEFRLVMLCLVLPVVMITIITQAVVYWRTSR